ncbi:hypothetical protein CROQUDRAFT_52776 [Cronartium quercuum f. sp. fusiforme G11]|uniref:JmjC domain-containing protein n=1 Tax=Cronartium quercuum f. sp. fusiforme G11 TaxID=708437 RepID=A0A9P6NB29_9BASI|nr:hypothetical protein CROQUDRAFT_52776 [Cronartium quercuum f. sp. fusiforme G11]
MNSAEVAELTDTIPTPLELSQYIGSNRPLVIRQYAQSQHRNQPRAQASNLKPHQIPSIGNWSETLLGDRLGDREVMIARTPTGKADSTIDDQFFVEPAYEQMPFNRFLAELQSVSTPSSSDSEARDVLYLQSQDGNLHKELRALLDDVGDEVPIASAAMGGVEPDAVNVWIGDDRSVTSLHKDPYENFYLVIEGSKTFTLFPPIEFYCMHETRFTAAQYLKEQETGLWSIALKGEQGQFGLTVPWIPVDPLEPDFERYPRFRFARPMKVVLMEGDLLYLPSLWYHHVQQMRTTPGGLVVACNWW